jgi:UDP:flavonoid glycosyltransferase YjiC (YdhE family)
MRFLFTTTGYPGHVLPLLPFAHACLRAGHEVCVAGPGSHGSLVRAAGLEYLELADPAEAELGRVVARARALPRAEGHAHMMSEGFGDVAARAVLPGLLQLVGAWRPDVIVRESHEFAGALAAERHGIPAVRVALGLVSTEDELASLAAGAVDQLRGEIGLPTDPGAGRIRTSPLLTLTPAALERTPLAVHRFREARGRAAVMPDHWPGRAGPLVYLTFGSVAGTLGFFPQLYRMSIDALAHLPVRVLVTLGAGGEPAELGALPPNVHVERWLPQASALGDAAAVVCHGGYGSTLGALARGLPLVAVPLFGADQWANASRVAALGAGVALLDAENGARRMFDGPGAEVLAALPGAVETVLDDPTYAAGARRLAEAIDALPPVEGAVDALRAIATPETDQRR